MDTSKKMLITTQDEIKSLLQIYNGIVGILLTESEFMYNMEYSAPLADGMNVIHSVMVDANARMKKLYDYIEENI